VTIFYPDVSHHNAGLAITAGTPIVVAKATQGTSFSDPEYERFRTKALNVGAVFVPYHFVEPGNAVGQARWYYAHAMKLPVMADFEPWTDGNGVSHRPSIADLRQFCAETVNLGGRVCLGYIPHWYWQELGSPDLTWMRDFDMGLVSSNYKPYSDTGPGWAPYGGMMPSVWQYTDSARYGGQSAVDFNAYKGTKDQFIQMVFGKAITDMSFDDVDKDHANQVWQVLSDAWVDSKEEVGEIDALSVGHQTYQTYKTVRDVLPQLDIAVDLLRQILQVVTNLQSGGTSAKEVVDEIGKRLAGS
jgi:hypothetical protein